MAETALAWPVGEQRRGWDAARFDLDSVTFALGDAELAALAEVAARVAGRPVEETDLADHASPVLDAFLAPAVDELVRGAGLMILRGLPVEGVPHDTIRRCYWAIGKRFGNPVSQNRSGSRIGEVKVAQGAAEGRAYASSAALRLHSDRIDIFSLLCVRGAKRGGESSFGSSLRIWDIVAEERPDLLPVLRRGFPQWRNGEEAAGDEPITPYDVPVFGEEQGLRSCLLSGNSSHRTVRARVRASLDPIEEEALLYLDDLLQRPANRLIVQLRPGESYFINNYEVLHGREAFEDAGGGDERLLLRLWLEGRPWRPRLANQTVLRNRSGHQGIDPRATRPA